MKEKNHSIIDELKKRSLEAFEKGHLLESAIIVFQLLEGLLRITVSGLMRGKGIVEEINNKCSNQEQSFYRLTIYYELLNPSNPLTERLQKLNNKRNSIMHKIFDNFETIDNLQKELDNFVIEAASLNQSLYKDLFPEKDTA